MGFSDLMVPVLLALVHGYLFGRREDTSAEDGLGTTMRIGSNHPLIAMCWSLDSLWKGAAEGRTWSLK